ncbi:MAG TPA: tagaturonate epimerase family protein [Polyangiaceae bacterium]
MSGINAFLLKHEIFIAKNPCISPDFCLDWQTLAARLARGDRLTVHAKSTFETAPGAFTLVEDERGEHAWILKAKSPGSDALKVLADGVALSDGRTAFPASWQNLLTLKNLVLEHDAGSTIFPTASGTLARQSLGVGARFTTLHWPAVEWAMAELGLSMTANQNSIPRELVYDVDAMLEGRLEGVAFPFIGAEVPEGHQGQSVEGMSHGAVLSKLKSGFHRRRIAWGFNADHQPVGGKFDVREAELVRGCLLASYITFDLSPELGQTKKPADAAAYCAENVPAETLVRVKRRVAEAGIALDEKAFVELLAAVWPAVQKMQRRDRLYAAERERAFGTAAGRVYFRELSIDELPGLTTPETLATMLALIEALGMKVHFVAPAFGFQKNFPFDDNAELERRIARAWDVCKAFGVSIGFHSGSGKSAENYRLCGRITGSRLEIKTSGRYTYEMGRALAASPDASDKALFADWYRFTKELATLSSFSANAQERQMARSFVTHALEMEKRSTDVFASPEECAHALDALTPSPDHMFWFEYNFLFVLAADGRAEKAALGDHGRAGYRQRARFYAVSPAGRLGYAKNVAEYLCFLAETTGQAPSEACARAKKKLGAYTSYDALVADIAPS